MILSEITYRYYLLGDVEGNRHIYAYIQATYENITIAFFDSVIPMSFGLWAVGIK